MSKQAYKRLRRKLGLEVNRKPPDAYAWPGGYPIIYICDDGEVLCPDCVAKEINRIDTSTRHDGWNVNGYDIHWEGPPENCTHCGKEIESAYGDPDEPEEDDEPELSVPPDDTPLSLQ